MKTVKVIANEILDLVDLEDTFRGIAPAFRGKPNEQNPDEGMDESVQKMYDGINDEGEPSKKYDQLPIVNEKRDWIDDEALMHKYRRHSSVREDFYDKEVDFYVNPKMTGEKVDIEILKNPDEEAMKYMDNFIEHYNVNQDEPPDKDRPKVKYPDKYLDNIEIVPRNRSVDDKAPWKNYWQENGMHRTRLMVNVKKIAKIILKG